MTSEGMTEIVVVVGLDQGWDLALIEIGLDVISAGSMIFCKCLSEFKIGKRNRTGIQMYNMDEEETSLKTLAADNYDSLNWVTSIGETGSDHLTFRW